MCICKCSGLCLKNVACHYVILRWKYSDNVCYHVKHRAFTLGLKLQFASTVALVPRTTTQVCWLMNVHAQRCKMDTRTTAMNSAFPHRCFASARHWKACVHLCVERYVRMGNFVCALSKRAGVLFNGRFVSWARQYSVLDFEGKTLTRVLVDSFIHAILVFCAFHAGAFGAAGVGAVANVLVECGVYVSVCFAGLCW